MPRTVHPLTSISFLLFCFLVAVVGQPPAQFFVFALLLFLSLATSKRKTIWRNIVTTILPIAILLIVVNRLLGTAMSNGVPYALRFVLLITPLVIIVHSTPAENVALALRTSPLPPRIQYLFIFSFEAVQSLRDLFQQALLAQRLRGLRMDRFFPKRWKNIIPVLFPVLLTAVSQGIDRGLALEFKGIESTGPKTHVRSLPLRSSDKLSIALLVLLSLIVIFLRLRF